MEFRDRQVELKKELMRRKKLHEEELLLRQARLGSQGRGLTSRERALFI